MTKLSYTSLSREELKAQLTKVLWIGGATDAGKTTVSRMLAAKYGWQLYHWDRPSTTMEGQRTEKNAPYSFAWDNMSDEERWLRSPQKLVQHLYQMWVEAYPYRIQDILSLPQDNIIVAEGYGFMPSFVEPLIIQKRQAIWLIPTQTFKEKTFRIRVQAGQKGGYRLRVNNPEQALLNHQQRDMLVAERVKAEATARNLKLLIIDDKRSLDTVFALVKRHFEL